MYDIIIIGAGPAGVAAAVYAARGSAKVLVISKDIGGQAAWSANIENYPGFSAISGIELSDKFREQLQKYQNIGLRELEEATRVETKGNNFNVTTAKGSYESKAVIVASGARPRELGIPGEKEFLNKGVAYCATCDGPLFRGKDVAIIGGGNNAINASLEMMHIASKVYILNITDALGGEAVRKGIILKAKNIEVISNARTTEIYGSKAVEGITYEKDGREHKLSVQAVFVEVGYIPNSSIVPFVEQNKNKEIKINADTSTNVPGLFAAGDVSDVQVKQVVVAAAEGCKAALSALQYLSQK